MYGIGALMKIFVKGHVHLPIKPAGSVVNWARPPHQLWFSLSFHYIFFAKLSLYIGKRPDPWTGRRAYS
jgi:hypothetical protein